MKQEEKLQEAKRLYKTANSGQRYVLESLFPELREDEYDRGYYDALKWVYDHTGGDNYKLSVKAKMQEFVRILNLD